MMQSHDISAGGQSDAFTSLPNRICHQNVQSNFIKKEVRKNKTILFRFLLFIYDECSQSVVYLNQCAIAQYLSECAIRRFHTIVQLTASH